MEKAKFWSRVGGWLKRPDPPIEDAGEGGTVQPFGFATPTTTALPGSVQAEVSDETSKPLSRFGFARPGSNLLRLEEEYGRLVKLVDAIETHLGAQAKQSEKMARSLDRLAENMSHPQETSRRDLELLATINESAASTAASAKRTEDSLLQLPRIADAQRESMVSLRQQLDLSQQTDERVAGVMGEVQQTVSKLGESADASAKGLRDMRWEASACAEHIVKLMEAQTKRLTIFAFSAIALAVVAAAVGAFALFR